METILTIALIGVLIVLVIFIGLLIRVVTGVLKLISAFLQSIMRFFNVL